MLVEHLLKTKKEYTNLNTETGDSIYICQNELNKACFWHNIAYGDFNDFPRGTAGKVLRDKAIFIVKNTKYDGYQRGLASVVYI